MAPPDPASLALVDAVLRHRVYLSRLENGAVRRLLTPLQDALDESVIMLASTESIRFGLPQRIAEIRSALLAAYQSLGEALPVELLDFAQIEAEFQAALLTRALATSFTMLPLAQLEHLITGPKAGSVLAESLARQRADVVNALRVSTSQSIILGEGIPGATKRFQKAADISKSSADALVRTSLLHASNAAAVESYRAAGIGADSTLWLSALDDRVCLDCGPRDGKTLDELGGQSPPAHFRCRCTVIPDITIDGVSLGQVTRASQDGPVKVSSYSAWFNRQDAAFQRDVLGPARAKLYRQGKLPLASFSDQGDILSLAELRQRHASMFEDA